MNERTEGEVPVAPDINKPTLLAAFLQKRQETLRGNKSGRKEALNTNQHALA